MYIDSHCHLESYKNLDEIIQKSKSSLEAIISCGHSIESSKQNTEIAKKYEGFVYPVVGIGPQAAMKMPAKNWKIEIPDSAVAVGEIGLDYVAAQTTEEILLQKECFSYYIDVAIQFNLPLVIHSRNAYDDVIEILKENQTKKVMWHCFTGTFKHAECINSQGHYISFPPIPSRTRVKIVQRLDIKLTVETDAPFIGMTPLDIEKSVELIAKAKNEKKEDIARITTENAKNLFSLDL